jgi:hypothetical protein
MSDSDSPSNRLRQRHPSTVVGCKGKPGNFPVSCGNGWMPILERCFDQFDAIFAGTGKRLQIIQIKEKFGTLRIQTEAVPQHLQEPVRLAIDEAELLSNAVCEECGAQGRLRDDEGWWATRCGTHASPGSAVASGWPPRSLHELRDGRRLVLEVDESALRVVTREIIDDAEWAALLRARREDNP